MQLFVDMDGVLADFVSHHHSVFGVVPNKDHSSVDWKAVRATPDFYLNIPPMPDLPHLWAVVGKHSPIVLTGVPSTVEEAPENKRAWARKNLGPNVEVRCCRSSEKYLHANPGDILIDDLEKYKHRWEAANGVWITHYCAVSTVARLAALGIT